MIQFEAPSPLLVFFNIILIWELLYLSKPVIKKGSLGKSRTRVVLGLCFVFCLFSFWGADWFGYLKYYNTIRNGWIDGVPMEDVYKWIMRTISPNYLFFRAIVWGASLFFFVQTIKRLKINIGLVLFFFCGIFLIYFSYARATLAITMMCYGYSFLWRKKTHSGNIISFIFGLSLICSSFFFHKSAILGIMAILVSIIVQKIGRVGSIIVLLSFPFFIIVVRVFFSEYFEGFMDSDNVTLSEYAKSGSSYLNSEGGSGFSGIGTFIQRTILERLPYYLLGYCCYKEIKSPSVNYKSNIYAMIVLMFVIVVTSLVFAFDLGVETTAIQTRYLRFAQAPACIVLSYFYMNKIQTHLITWTYKIGIFACFYSLIYVFYNSFYY